MDKATRKNIYLDARTLAQIGGRDSLSGRIRSIVDRYHEICRRERPLDGLSDAERSAILDACMSWLPEPAATIFGGVEFEVSDALRDGLAEKWSIDGDALVSKLRAMAPGAQIALVDWIEAQRG
jgi:hypothetical protein